MFPALLSYSSLTPNSEDQAGEYDAMIQPGMGALSFSNPLTGQSDEEESGDGDSAEKRQVEEDLIPKGSDYTINTTEVRELLEVSCRFFFFRPYRFFLTFGS